MPEPIDLTEIEPGLAEDVSQLRELLYGSDVKSSLGQWSEVHLSGPQIALVDSETAGQITQAINSITGQDTDDEPYLDTVGEFYDGRPAFDLMQLLGQLNPGDTPFDEPISDRDLTASAVIEYYMLSLGYRAAGSRLLPTADNEANAWRARLFVDQSKGDKDLLHRIWSGQSLIHPRSTNLFAALATDNFDDQGVMSAELDQLVRDTQKYSKYPFIGESIDGQVGFLAQLKPPKGYLGYRQAKIVLPLHAGSHGREGIVQIFDRDFKGSHPPTLDFAMLDPQIWHYNLTQSLRSPEELILHTSQHPMVSLVRVADGEVPYYPRLHDLFRRGFPSYIVQLAEQSGHPDASKMRATVASQTRKVLTGPRTQAAFTAEADHFLSFISKISPED